MMSEHALQVAVAHMLQLVLDPARAWFTGIDHAAKLSARYGAARKRRGVKKGLPDFIIVPLCDRILGLELKTMKGRLTQEQCELRDDWLQLGHRYHVARSLEEVQEILDHYRIPMRQRMQFFAGAAHDRPQRAAPSRHPRARRRRKPKDHLPVVLTRPT